MLDEGRPPPNPPIMDQAHVTLPTVGEPLVPSCSSMTHTEITQPADDVASATPSLGRLTVLSRIAGTVLIVVGVVGLAAWLWVVVRTQQTIDDGGGGPLAQPAPSVSFVDRVDASVGSTSLLLFAALTGGAGFALRLMGRYSEVRQEPLEGDPLPNAS